MSTARIGSQSQIYFNTTYYCVPQGSTMLSAVYHGSVEYEIIDQDIYNSKMAEVSDKDSFDFIALTNVTTSELTKQLKNHEADNPEEINSWIAADMKQALLKEDAFAEYGIRVTDISLTYSLSQQTLDELPAYKSLSCDTESGDIQKTEQPKVIENSEVQKQSFNPMPVVLIISAVALIVIIAIIVFIKKTKNSIVESKPNDDGQDSTKPGNEAE